MALKARKGDTSDAPVAADPAEASPVVETAPAVYVPLGGGAMWEALAPGRSRRSISTEQLLELLDMAERHAPEVVRDIRAELATREVG